MLNNKIIHSFLHGDVRSVTVKKNIIGSLAVKAVSIIVSLMLVPLTLGYVSSELYGIWLTLSSITVWLSFFDIGFTLGLKNKLAEAIALEDWERGKSLVSTTYMIMIAVFVPLCVVLEFLIPCVDWATFLNVSSQYNEEIIKALHMIALFFCLQMIVNVLQAVVAAFQKVALSSVFPVIGNVLSLIIIWGLSRCYPPSLTALAFAISAMPVLVLFGASILFYSKRFSRVSPSVKYVDRKYVKNIFDLGARFFIIQIQVVVLYQSTNILISNVSGPDDVTAYNIVYKYMSIAMMVYSIILAPMWPAFTDAYTKGDYNWMQNVYKKMIRLYLLSAGVMAVMTLLSPIVYALWIGDKAEIPFLMTIVVCIYMLVHNWDSLQVYLINGIGCIHLQTYVTLIGLIVHIPLSLFLGNVMNLGAIGVVISMIVINIIYASFFTVQINKILRQKAFGIWAK